MPRPPTRPVTANGGRARLTVPQYRALQYWAANTFDDPARTGDPRPYPERCGIPLYRLSTRTGDALRTRGWWLTTRRGYVVTDLGRRAVGLPPVHRDRACPLPDCSADRGERCRVPISGGPGPYTDRVHEARVALHVPPTGPIHLPRTVRDRNGERTPEMELAKALDRHLPTLADQLRSGGLEPRHIGFIAAT